MVKVNKLWALLITVVTFAPSFLTEAKFTPRKVELSHCLTYRASGLFYRHTGAVNCRPRIKTGCYVKYRNGVSRRDSEDSWYGNPAPIEVLQYFVIDSSGYEINVSINQPVTIDISESKPRTFTWNQICFPEACYGNSADHFRPCLKPFPIDYPCSIFQRFLDYVLPREGLGKVKDYESEVFCGPRFTGTQTRDGIEYPAFNPYNGKPVVYSGGVPGSLNEPYIMYKYTAGSQGIYYGCEIARPLSSNVAFRRFNYNGNGTEHTIHGRGVVSLSLKETCTWLPPQEVSFRDFCFLPNCYQPNEEKHCGAKIGKPYTFTASAIIYHAGYEQTELLNRFNRVQ